MYIVFIDVYIGDYEYKVLTIFYVFSEENYAEKYFEEVLKERILV